MSIGILAHKHPDQCLSFLDFRYSDGGRREYFNRFFSSDPPSDIQDCSVIAVSVAMARNAADPPSWQSYAEANSGLRAFNRGLKPWNVRRSYENCLEYCRRRVRQTLLEAVTTRITKHRNPIYGTDSNVYGAYLERIGRYSFVFEDQISRGNFCLCNARGRLVVDGYFERGSNYTGRNAHVTAIIDGVVTGPVDISNSNFHVVHVWQKI